MPLSTLLSVVICFLCTAGSALTFVCCNLDVKNQRTDIYFFILLVVLVVVAAFVVLNEITRL